MSKTSIQKKYLSSLAIMVISFGLLITWQSFLFNTDNKYTNGAPYGSQGIFSFTEEDLDRPLFLIDGWILNDNEVFIGQYSNFSYLQNGSSPFGVGIYELTLRYTGKEDILLLEIPEIFTEYTLLVNGKVQAKNRITAVPIAVGRGDVELRIIAQNYSHYYSGLTYPPALGTVSVINNLFFIRTLIYGGICFSTLSLAIFSFAIWRKREKNSFFLNFGLLSISFCLNCVHPLLRHFGFQNTFFYILEDISWLLVLGQTLEIAAISIGIEKSNYYKFAVRPTALLMYIFVLVSMLWIIPNNGNYIPIYGLIVDGYKILIFIVLTIFTGIGLSRLSDKSDLLILCATCILGTSLYIDVIDSNKFEPIYGLWQNEYAGLFLVFVFAYFMILKNKLLLRESEELGALKVQYQYATENAQYLRESMDQVRIIKHDINEHISSMNILFNNHEYDRLGQYLNKLNQNKNNLPTMVYTNHYIINAIISSCFNNLKKIGTHLDYKINIPNELSISDYDLCALFSNVLSNAKDAIINQPPESEKYLSIVILANENMLSFECVNSCKKPSDPKNFSTIKKDRDNHGFGLSTIKKISKKYNGSISHTFEDCSFTIKGVLFLNL